MFIALCAAAAALSENSWWLKNTGQAYGIPGEDINYEGFDSTKYNGEGIRILVMGDGADVNHHIYSGHTDAEEFRELWSDTVEQHTDLLPVTAAQKVLGLVGGSHNNKCGFDGVAPGATLLSYRFHEPSITGRNVSFEDSICHRQNSWDISILLFRDWDCEIIDGHTQCKYCAQAGWIRQTLNDCLYEAEAKPKIFIVPAGNDNLTTDIFFSPPTRWPLLFTVSSVSNRGVPLNRGAEGAGIFIACPGSRMNPDTPPAKIPYAVPGGKCSSDLGPEFSESFEYSNASAAIFAGGVAIVLQANPDLTIPDLFYIFGMTATVVSPTSPLWNKHYWTDDKYLMFNRRCGFGRMDLGKAVALAEKWTSVGDFKTVTKFDDTSLDLGMYTMKRTAFVNFTITPEDVDSDEAYFLEALLVIKGVNLEMESIDIVLIKDSEEVSELKIMTEPVDDKEYEMREYEFSCKEFLGSNLFGTWNIAFVALDWVERGTLVNVSLQFYYTTKRPDPSLIDQENGIDSTSVALPDTALEFEASEVQWNAGDTTWSTKLKWKDTSKGQDKCSYIAWLDQENVEVTIGHETRTISPHLKLQTGTFNEGETEFRLPYIPSLYKDGIEGLSLRIESWDEKCGGWSASVPIRYSQSNTPGKMYIHKMGKYGERIYIEGVDEYASFNVSLDDWQEDSGVGVTWFHNYSYVLEDGYAFAAALSLATVDTQITVRRGFTSALGYGNLNITLNGNRASDRKYYIDVTQSSYTATQFDMQKAFSIVVYIFAQKDPVRFESELKTWKNIMMLCVYVLGFGCFVFRLVMVNVMSWRRRQIDSMLVVRETIVRKQNRLMELDDLDEDSMIMRGILGTPLI